ncbi:hypothetical protein PV356_20865 [Streptomyces sp. WI03-5b]|uniref:hypothetical protein n=1 Tax=Streptomyces sp. WI03-5b TaxID=462946 RepID=UPI0029AA4C98|nr:hypothetical protein [Streptomyces sp. WI03-5b]MDX2621954.1 hypothetical protein [Streptomyces sp. WI03-5b]
MRADPLALPPRGQGVAARAFEDEQQFRPCGGEVRAEAQRPYRAAVVVPRCAGDGVHEGPGGR